jgi:hypothetical protein
MSRRAFSVRGRFWVFIGISGCHVVGKAQGMFMDGIRLLGSADWPEYIPELLVRRIY